MESGIIPLLFIVTLISAIVLTAILSLILSVSVLEKRKDFAIMKVLGSPRGFIPWLVIRVSMMLSLTGVILALVIFFPMIGIVEKIFPESLCEIICYPDTCYFIRGIVNQSYKFSYSEPENTENLSHGSIHVIMIQNTSHIVRLVNVPKRYEGPHGGTPALRGISFAASPR